VRSEDVAMVVAAIRKRPPAIGAVESGLSRLELAFGHLKSRSLSIFYNLQTISLKNMQG